MLRKRIVSHPKLVQYRAGALRYAASSGALLVANVTQLLTFSVLARFLGVEAFGQYVAFIAISNIAVYLCGLGASECLVRRVAQDPESYPRLMGHNLILIAVSGAALVAVGMVLMPMFIHVSPDGVTNALVTFLLLVTNIVLVRLIMLAETACLGLKRFAEANQAVLVFALARFAATVLACIVFGVSSIAGWAVWQFACHAIVALIYAWRMLRFGRPRLHVAREEIRLGLFFATPFIFKAIRQNSDLAVLGILASPEIVASYGIARRVSDGSFMAIEALNRIMYPSLAEAGAKGVHPALRRCRELVPFALLLGAAAALVVFLSAPWMPLAFGKEYVSLPGYLRAMSGYILIVAFWAMAMETLGATSQHKWRAWVLNVGNGVGAVAIAGATWVFPPWGAFIASYAMEIAIAVAAWTILLRLARKEEAADARTAPVVLDEPPIAEAAR